MGYVSPGSTKELLFSFLWVFLAHVEIATKSVQYRGDKKKLENVTISNFLPETIGYMTYEGSQTAPGCSEVVNWIIINKPIYITQKQVCVMSIFFFSCQVLLKICSTALEIF